MSGGRAIDRSWWDEYFAPGGGWERNGGRRQTRVFAEHFTDRIRLDPGEAFSLLDVGCALGEALKHFAKVYPRASLYGIDFSATAIERGREELGNTAVLSVGTFEDTQGHYDIIYCSNTLEHFPDFQTKARILAQHCNRLCVLVPYEERDHRLKPLVPNPAEQHQHTFLRDSFDFLVEEGLAKGVETQVFSCPGAWGWTIRTRIEQSVKNVARVLLGRPRRVPRKQILFDIRLAD
jgi:SAM-dependent methyltransferase